MSEASRARGDAETRGPGLEAIEYELPVPDLPGPGAGRRRVIRGTVELPEPSARPAPVVHFCHGFKGFKDWGAWPWFACRLAARGLAVNRFNFSLSGVGPSLDSFDEPDKFAVNTYGAELDDLELLVRTWSGAPDGPGGGVLLGVPAGAATDEYALVGHSRGGLVALLAAGARDGTIAGAPPLAVVTLGSPGHSRRHDDATVAAWRERGHLDVPNARTGEILRLEYSVFEDYRAHAGRYDLPAVLARRTVPTRIVHGEDDESVPVAEAHELFESIPHDECELVVIPETGHTFGAAHPFDGPTPALEHALELTVSWLERVRAS